MVAVGQVWSRPDVVRFDARERFIVEGVRGEVALVRKLGVPRPRLRGYRVEALETGAAGWKLESRPEE